MASSNRTPNTEFETNSIEGKFGIVERAFLGSNFVAVTSWLCCNMKQVTVSEPHYPHL